MSFFSDPYAEGHAADVSGMSEQSRRYLAEAAKRGYTGQMVTPDGTTYEMEQGNVTSAKPAGGGWMKFAITAAALVGGGIAAGGGLAGAGATAGETAADTSYIGADVANTAAAAEGGGGLGSILSGAEKVAGKVAPILGNMAKAGADANANRDRILPGMESAQLARDKFALDAPTTRMKQSMQGSIINSASPTKVNWGGPGSGLRGQVPTFTGGFSGALANIDPRTKALADQVMSKDLTDQLSGHDSQTKYLDQFGHTSPMDKIVGGASTAVSLLDAWGNPIKWPGTPPTV